MIRRIQKKDVEKIAEIWLNTNLKAHDFIKAEYWTENFPMVKALFCQAEVYVYEEASEILGFVGIEGTYIAGIFVRGKAQSKGIGKQLLDYVKEIKGKLTLSVYQKNVRAVKFYQRENFMIQSECIDENTGEVEYFMEWNAARMEKEYTYHYDSPLGAITMSSDGEALTGLWFEGQKYFGSTLTSESEQKNLSVFEETICWLDVYFEGKKPDFIPKLKLKGTKFRRMVWEILLEIPYGQTMTYKEIADKVAKQRGMESMSAQAVGGAVGHNPISLIVPCHRVIGTDGSLTGYAGGMEKKAELLKMEHVDI